jgi:hypothetical protein
MEIIPKLPFSSFIHSLSVTLMKTMSVVGLGEYFGDKEDVIFSVKDDDFIDKYGGLRTNSDVLMNWP